MLVPLSLLVDVNCTFQRTKIMDFWDMPPCILVIFTNDTPKTIILIHTAMRSLNLTFLKCTEPFPYCFIFYFSWVEWA